MSYDSIFGEICGNDDPSPMTLGELMDAFANAGDLPVVFLDADQYTVGDLMSWRGSYDVPALSYEPGSKTGKQLFEQLNEQIQWKHHGYKGGEYMYTVNDCPYISQYGSASEYMIVKTEQENGSLVLYTKVIPY